MRENKIPPNEKKKTKEPRSRKGYSSTIAFNLSGVFDLARVQLLDSRSTTRNRWHRRGPPLISRRPPIDSSVMMMFLTFPPAGFSLNSL